MFETASTIINLQQQTDFERLIPLKGFNSTLFTIQYSFPDDEHLIYSIIEKESHLKEKISLEFSSEFGKSYLKKTIELAPNSNTVPTNLPLFLSSIDKMLKLSLMPGTTINLRGAAIPNLTIQQVYIGNATKINVPHSEELDNSIIYGNDSWNLTYPVYELGPSPIRFNEPQILILHWDEDENPANGEMGLLYEDEDGWRPLPVETDYKNNNIWTTIPGWGLGEEFKAQKNQDNLAGSAIEGAITVSFKEQINPIDTVKVTPVSCKNQSFKSKSISSIIDPDAGCIGRLIGMIIALIIAAIIIVATLGIGTGSVTGFLSWLVNLGSPVLVLLKSTLIVIIGGIAAGAIINGAISFGAGPDYIALPVTCDQTVEVTKTSHGGKGVCMINYRPETSLEVKGGRKVTVSSQMPKCSFWRAMWCQKCSVKCIAEYK